MGVNIAELLIKKEISIKDLSNKAIAIDAPLFLYQFLTTIRARDGTLLMDSKGKITSHLVGLFSRTTNLMQNNINVIYVFDGKPPELKHRETEKRKNIKIEAEKRYKEAKEKEDLEEMKKYAARTSRLTSDMIEEAKKLIKALGLPVVNAPCEGEAQAAHIVKNGDAFAAASQDADSLMFGSLKLVRNLSISGRKKKANQLSYEQINPEIIDLAENLNNLGIDKNQLIALGILIGTDYNPGGVKGIGPKNALKLVKQYPNNFEGLFKEIKWEDEHSWREIFDLIKDMPVTNKYALEWKPVDKEEIIKTLVDAHDFSIERVNSALEKFETEKEKKQQKGLTDFFG